VPASVHLVVSVVRVAAEEDSVQAALAVPRTALLSPSFKPA
jgi:hypothetical protein